MGAAEITQNRHLPIFVFEDVLLSNISLKKIISVKTAIGKTTLFLVILL